MRLSLFVARESGVLCSADGSTHTESNKLYRKVKHRSRPNFSSRQRPKRAPIRRRSRSGGARDVSRGAGSHTPSTASESFSLKQLLTTLSLSTGARGSGSSVVGAGSDACLGSLPPLGQGGRPPPLARPTRESIPLLSADAAPAVVVLCLTNLGSSARAALPAARVSLATAITTSARVCELGACALAILLPPWYVYICVCICTYIIIIIYMYI